VEGDVQWTVTVSKETDAVVRTFLAQRGMNRRTLASFVEDAVRWRMFSATVAETKARNADVPVNEIDAAITEALGAIRSESRQRAGVRHTRR
jgi:hypothetical protein